MTDTTEQDTDWAGRAAATVVGYVDTVRSASTGKALVASRIAVYGVAMGLIGLVMGILLLVVLVRLVASITAVIPGLPIEPGEVWLSYLILGSIFLLGGWFLWRKREE